MTIHAATAEAVERAAAALMHGALVAFPTETVYGLGADAGNPAAVERIFAAKGRPADHPVIVHLAGADALPRWARTIPEGARRLAAAFWPGPLTLILPRAGGVADVVTGGQDTVGLRVPSHPVARALLDAFARQAGTASPHRRRTASAASRRRPRATSRTISATATAMILDGGACAIGIESTIVAFDGDEPVLLRPGGLPLGELARVLGQAPLAAGAGAPRASGTLAAHYAPRTRMQLITATALRGEARQRQERDENPAVLAHSVPRPEDFSGTWIAAPGDCAGYAHDLYANLRRLDAVERRRDPGRAAAARRCVARRARSPRTRRRRQRRRPRLASLRKPSDERSRDRPRPRFVQGLARRAGGVRRAGGGTAPGVARRAPAPLPDGRWRRGDARRRPRRVGQRRRARFADGARRRWRPGGDRLRRPRRKKSRCSRSRRSWRSPIRRRCGWPSASATRAASASSSGRSSTGGCGGS